MEKSSTATIHGRSMEPFLFQGDTVELAPIANNSLEQGHVYVFKDSLHAPIAHRLRSIKNDILVFQGDRQHYSEKTSYANVFSETRRVIHRTIEPNVELIVLGILKNYRELNDFFPIKNSTAGWDWTKILSFLAENKLIPLFGIAIKKANLWQELPIEIQNIFLQSFNESIARFEAIKETKNKILKVLPNAFFIKGAKLAEDLYQDPFVRVMNDIDFVVPEQDFLRSIEVLKMNGFVFSIAMDEVASFYHQVGGNDSKNGIHIEVHKTLFQDHRYKFDSEAYRNDFSSERELLYLCAHAVCHWGRHVFSVYDIYNILKAKKIDFEKTARLAEEQNCLLATSFIFKCIKEWWNMENDMAPFLNKMNFFQKFKLYFAEKIFKNDFHLNVLGRKKHFLQVLLFDDSFQLIQFIFDSGRRKMKFID